MCTDGIRGKVKIHCFHHAVKFPLSFSFLAGEKKKKKKKNAEEIIVERLK